MVIYLDKNHPANGGIEAAAKLIDLAVAPGTEYCKIHLVPEMKNELIKSFPFSYEFLGQCLYSGKQRKDHPTLNNANIPHLYSIMFLFFNFNRNKRFEGVFCEKQGLDGFLSLPMTNENIKASEHLKETLEKCINDIPFRGLIDQDNENLNHLISIIDQQEDLRHYPDVKY